MAKKQKPTVNTRRVLGALGKKDLTQREAKLVINEARKQLVLRKPELLKELEKRIEIKKTKSRLEIFIPGFAKLICRLSLYELRIHQIQVGDFFSKYHSLRGLGIADLLIKRAINFAKERDFITITLSCRRELIPFYERFGFKSNSRLESYVDMTLWL